MHLLRSLKKSSSIILSSSLILSSLPSSWADDDWLRRNNSQQPSTYQQPPAYQPTYTPVKVNIPDPYKPPQQLDVYKTPTGPLDTESRGILQATIALKPAQVPDSFLSSQNKPVAPKSDTTPISFQFSTAIKTPPLQDVRQVILMDVAASAPKRSFFESVGKVFHALGEAFAGAGRKVVQALQAVVRLFHRSDPSAAQKISQEFNARQISPGVFQTTPDTQTFAYGKVWESGSTFKATPTGVRLLQGVTMTQSIGGLSRADGRELPVKMIGRDNGAIDPQGIDFTRLNPGTALTTGSSIDIPAIGTIQAAQITYTGQKNGDPVLEVQGRGSISVDGISDLKVMKQAEQQLSMKLRLMNGSFEVKDAVLTVGGTKTYLETQGKGTPISAIESGVQGIADLAAPLLTDAKKQATSAEQNARAVNALLKNLFNQTGHELTAPLQATNEAAKQKSSVEAFTQRAAKAQANVQAENYGDAIAALPTLKEEGSSLQKSQAQVTGKVEALKRFNKALRGLTADLKDLYPKINREGIVEQQSLRKDILADRAARHFPEEKASYAAHTDEVLGSLIALVDSKQVDVQTAKTWGQTLITARTQILGAVPQDGSLQNLKNARPQEDTAKLIGQGMDNIFFNEMARVAQTEPEIAGGIAQTGLWFSQGAKAATEGIGATVLAYYLGTAFVVTAGSVAAGYMTKKGLQRIGVSEDLAGVGGAAVSLLVPQALSKLPGGGTLGGMFSFVKGKLSGGMGDGTFGRIMASQRGGALVAVGPEAPPELMEVSEIAPLNARPVEQLGTQTPNFYARPNGEIVPANGYRYISSNAKYLGELIKTGKIPANSKGTYITFEKIDNPLDAPGKLQVPHDAVIRVEFDTKQVLDDIRIPNGRGGVADHLEPLTADFPNEGPGGATQAITQQEIRARRIIDLRTGKVLYESR